MCYCLFLADLCLPDLLSLLCVMISCVFVTFPYGVLVQVLYLIVLIPGICLLPYIRIKPGNGTVGHQVNSDTHLQTV